MLKPDGGEASINGFDVVAQEKLVRKCISLTGQFTAVDEVLTGRENLNLIGQLMRLPDVKSKTNEWLSFSICKMHLTGESQLIPVVCGADWILP